MRLAVVSFSHTSCGVCVCVCVCVCFCVRVCTPAAQKPESGRDKGREELRVCATARVKKTDFGERGGGGEKSHCHWLFTLFRALRGPATLP